jgi:hypothetical protein
MTGKRWSLEPDATLQLDTIHSRHPNICNYAARHG